MDETRRRHHIEQSEQGDHFMFLCFIVFQHSALAGATRLSRRPGGLVIACNVHRSSWQDQRLGTGVVALPFACGFCSVPPNGSVEVRSHLTFPESSRGLQILCRLVGEPGCVRAQLAKTTDQHTVLFEEKLCSAISARFRANSQQRAVSRIRVHR